MGRKKEERLMSLAAFLAHSGRSHTLGEIRSVMPEYAPGEAGRQMFIRDKKELIQAGFGVVEADDRYSIPRDRLYLDGLFLEDAERAALMVALLSVEEGRASVGSVGATFGGFGDLLTTSRGTTSVFEADLNADARVRVLHAAVSERRRVTARYSGRDRVLEPYGLVSRRGNWYVNARDQTDGERKNFRVERFESDPVAANPPDAFRAPSDLDLAKELQDSWQLPADVRFDVTVDVDEHLAGRAAFEVGDRAELEWRADGSLRITMPVTHLGAFRSWLLTYLDHAVVDGPVEVRSHVRSWLSAFATSA
jgi:predicted DNA-binding transcriptional regulator YafY